MSASDKKKLRKEQEAATLTEKQLSQKKEDKQLKNYTVAFVAAMILIVAIVLGSMGMNWYNGSGSPARSTVAPTVGEYELSNADLNYYFIDAINAFYNDIYSQYSTYTTLAAQTMYGLDMTQPLNAQYYNEATGETWADYFINDAITYAEATYSLYAKAMEAGFQLSEDDETYLNASLASTRAQAGLAGYDNMEAYLKAYYGNGADEESYVNYYRVNAIADAYYTEYANSLSYTEEQIDTYNTEHYNDFSTFDYSYYYINIKNFLDEGVELAKATEEQRNNAAKAAKEAAELLANATDLTVLNNLIAGLDFNKGNTTAKATEIDRTGYGSIATLYNEWIADSARTANETTVVEYESDSDQDELVDGYYVVMFEGRNDFSEKMRSVRHILVKFEGGTQQTNEDGTKTTVYSDAEKQKARDEAQALYDQWVAGGASQDSFIALVKDNSDDGGSSNNGGLYENVYQGQMVEAFDAWLFDANRKDGDHAIVETEIGYHLMYYVCEQENTYRQLCVEQALRNKDVGTWYEALLKDVTSTKGNTDYIFKGLVLASPSTTPSL